jgi:uncharacterized protein YdiU (UPF0061 family)
MHALGVPTSRALAVTGSKKSVLRESLETAAVCTRLAPSFIRVGHFEHFAAARSTEHITTMADCLLMHHYPECQGVDDPYLALFAAISERTAKLVAHWQAIGFCHGVLNSDNISILGLTIDYGPFGFLDRFQMDHICNHSDNQGRYAYQRQPQIMHWNMACLAEAMLPLIEQRYDGENAQTHLQEALEKFPEIYRTAWLAQFRAKLGLKIENAGDMSLIESLLKLMHGNRVDFTNTFRALSHFDASHNAKSNPLRDQFLNRDAFDSWMQSYLDRLKEEKSSHAERQSHMLATNPKFVLRNYLAQTAIEKAQNDDFSEVKRLLEILQDPYSDQPGMDQYAVPPPAALEQIEVSCSS